jgi:uncharacterized protein YjbI with pentapeptide repeats
MVSLSRPAGLSLIASLAGIALASVLLSHYVHPATASERFQIVQTIGQFIGGLALVIGLFFTWWNLLATQKAAQDNLINAQQTLSIAQDGQITDRFSKAIEQLGNANAAVRLGGIYALERIAHDSQRDYTIVFEVLTAFVREHARCEPTTETTGSYEPAPADIQAILTTIGRRQPPYGAIEESPIFLAQVKLINLHLERANLTTGIFWDTRFDGSPLVEANLDGARLTGASFLQCNMQRATLKGALLSGTKFDRADLTSTAWQGSIIQHASFEGAILDGADFRGVDLSTAQGLHKKQIAAAVTDATTILPKRTV